MKKHPLIAMGMALFSEEVLAAAPAFSEELNTDVTSVIRVNPAGRPSEVTGHTIAARTKAECLDTGKALGQAIGASDTYCMSGGKLLAHMQCSNSWSGVQACWFLNNR